MKRRKAERERPSSEVVRLEDLAPQENVQGGAGKLRFGERRDNVPEGERRPPRSARLRG